MELLIILVLSLLLVPLVIFTSGILRMVLGFTFVFFFPGYTLLAALFPRKGALDGVARLALSFGLSIVVASFIGLALNYTSWGLRVYPVLLSLLLFVVLMAAIAWYRRRGLVPEERFEPRFRLDFSWVSGFLVFQSRWEKLVAALVVVMILGSLGTLGYVIGKPGVAEKFTEFYMVDQQGGTENLPASVFLGKQAAVKLRIVCHEPGSTDYRVETTINGEKVAEVGPITLKYKEEREMDGTFAPSEVGSGQKVEFLLYRGSEAQPYLRLLLWIDVR